MFSEILFLFNSVFNVFSLVLVFFIIPFAKLVFDLRLRMERIEVLLDIILKDVEKLKKEIRNGKKSEN